MYTYSWVFFLFAALCGQSVFGSYYHGPIAKPVVLKSGYLADTHEVAAAKSAHLATIAKQSPYGDQHGYAGDYGFSHDEQYSGSYRGKGHVDYRYKGPIAIPHVLHDGHIADTHEVAAAKAEHYAAVAKAKTVSSHGHAGGYDGYSEASHGHYNVPYHGPIAKPVVLKSGFLADTHEVAAAKSAHLATLVKQSHYGDQHGYAGDYGYGGYSQGEEYSGSYSKGSGDYRYKGPIAIPHVLHDGHMADTHEVAAAKAEHYAAVAEAKTISGHEYAGGYGGYFGAPHGHYTAPYHGPTAMPVVLKSGYLADTHEVASAKHHHLETLSNAKVHVNEHY